MTAETLPAIRAETVLAAVAELDAADRRTANVVCNLGLTRSLLADTSPHDWEMVAAYVIAQLQREPLKSSRGYAVHRMILGAFASELRTYAHDAGEPVGAAAHLAEATNDRQADAIQRQLDDDAAEFSRTIDDALAASAAQRAADEETNHDEPRAPETTTDDDAFLLP